MDNPVLEILKTIFSMATPFIILGLGWWYNRKNKNEQEKKQTEQQLAEAKEKERKDALDEAIEKLEQVQAKAESNADVNEELRKSIDHFMSLAHLNGRYTHELAELVMTLAEGLRDQHLDGNITRAVAKYRKFESDTLGSFMTGEEQK